MARAAAGLHRRLRHSSLNRDGDSWTGYRQFCMMFIIPLLLKAHRDIQLAPLLRRQSGRRRSGKRR
jgi:hypothetical protein